MEEALLLENVSYSYHTKYGETYALYNISMSVPKGSFVSVVGPSGCGKSTLLSLICGILKPESGHILVNGRETADPACDIGYMLQHDQLFEWRTVWGNVILGLEIRKKKTDENLRNTSSMLDQYGLGEFRGAKPSELSGGMRQRAALIRTLTLRPDILLLDEPFSALDYQTRLSVCEDISSIIKKERKTAVLVTHDLAEAISVADTVYVLSSRPGRIVASVETAFEPGLTSIERRNVPQFKEYFNTLWRDLNENT